MIAATRSADLRSFVAERGIAGFVGLLTAVWMRKARSAPLRAGDLTVCAVMTAGAAALAGLGRHGISAVPVACGGF
ncbi:MAG: hypothetical protein ACUVSX_01760 [Aggregatilineales bacterium]